MPSVSETLDQSLQDPKAESRIQEETEKKKMPWWLKKVVKEAPNKGATINRGKEAPKISTVDFKEAPKIQPDNVPSDISVEVMEEGCVTKKGEVKEKLSLVELLSEAVESQKGLLIHLSSSLLDCFLKDENFKNLNKSRSCDKIDEKDKCN